MQSTGGRFNCAYNKCATKVGEKISLFSFPRDQERAKLWVLHCDRRDLESTVPADQLNKCFKVCEKHFAPKDIDSGGLKKRLRCGALPTYEKKDMPSKKDKGEEAAREGGDALDINSTDLSNLFGNNVEFIIEEDSQIISISEATEVAADDPLKIPSKSTDFNSSFKNFIEDKVAKEKARTSPIPKLTRAAKRKLTKDDQIMPELKQPNPKDDPVSVMQESKPIMVPAATSQLFLINGISPIPLAIQINPSGLGYVMQPVVVPTVPVTINNQNQVPVNSAKKPAEPRAVDRVNILRKKLNRVEVIPPEKLAVLLDEQDKKKLMNKKAPPSSKGNVLRKKLKVGLEPLPPKKHDEYSAILGTPVSNEYTNINKLLTETKERLSEATNGRGNAEKAEYIMVADTETTDDDNNKPKMTILNDKVVIKVPDESNESNGEDIEPVVSMEGGGLCYVPKCSLKKGEKVFLFKAPYDEQLLDVWQKCIGRTDRLLKSNDTICEKHFSKKDVQVLVQHQGTKLMAFPRLKKTAIPCIEYFEGCCVPRCGKTAGRMFKFPFMNPHAVRLWLYMIKAPELPKLPLEKLVRYRVCERHFEPTSFDDKGELIHSAAPTRYVPVTAGKFIEVTTEAAIPKESPKMPTLKCIFWNCPLNKRQDSNSRIFLFPNDFDRCRQWLRICKRTDMLRATATRTLIHLSRFGYGVCSKHFVEEDYANSDKSQLKRKAYPKVDPSNDDCIVVYSPPVQDRVLTCAVTFCEEDHQNHQKHFPFPNPDTDKERYQIWLRLVSNPDLLKMGPETIRNSYGICQKHFESHFFNRTPGEDELVNIAVPTKNLTGSKTWLFGTKFYQSKVKEYINKCINADFSSIGSNMNWKISDFLDDTYPKSVCTLDEHQIRFPGIGHHLDFNNANKRAPFEVFNCSRQNFKLVSSFDRGEMLNIHSAVIIADDNKVQKEVMQNLIDEMKW